MTINIYPAGTYSYFWNATGNNTSHSGNLSAGDYDVDVWDASGCLINFSGALTEPEPILVNAFPVDTELCTNSPVQICSTPGFASYHWTNGVSTTCNSVQNSAVYSVTVTDADGCTAVSNPVNITIHHLPNVILTASQTIFCSGDFTTVCATSGFSSYLWNFGIANDCISPSSAGTYWVTVTDANNCTAVSNHLALSIYPLSSVSISVNGNVLTAFNALTYQWYLNDTLINGANSSTYVATQSGSYSLQATDTNGCQTFSNAINVVVSGIAPLAFGEGLGVRIFPNPFTNELSVVIQKQNIKHADFIITNVLGQQLYKKEETNLSNYYTKQLNLSKFASGVYFVEINVDEEKIVKQIVKQ